MRVLVPEQLGTEENGSPAYSPPPLLVEANDVYGYASLCKGKCGLLDEDLISTVSTETCWYTEEWAWSAIRDEIDIYRPSNWLSQDTVRELFTTSHWNRAPSARCAMARDVLVWHGVDPDKIYDFVFGHREVAWATLMESYLQDAQNRHVELLESLEKGGWRSDTYYRRGVHEICKQVEDLLACAGWDASQFDLARLKSFVDCVGSHLGFEEEGAA